jgi:inosose dehydratase
MNVAGAPISWGVCEVPGWGEVLPPHEVLDDMRSLGLPATELGPPGYLPTDPDTLKATLDKYELALVGGFAALVLHDPAVHDATVREARRTAGLLAATGGAVLVLAAATGRDGYDSRPVLDDTGWAHLTRTLGDIAAEVPIATTLHPHVGTMIESAAEVDRVLASSPVQLCLDTGHLLIGGADPLALARDHADRISHVHLKDVDARLAARVRTGELTYMAGVQSGLYKPLGDGDVPIARIVSTLESAGYVGWYVLEQDTALGTGDQRPNPQPHRDTARSLEFLARI